MARSALISPVTISVGQSTELLLAPVQKDFMNIVLVVTSPSLDSQVQLRVDDLDNPGNRPGLAVVDGPGQRTIRLENIPQSMRLTMTCMAGRATCAVYENVEVVGGLGFFSPFRRIDVLAADLEIDLSLGFNLHAVLGADCTFTFINAQDGERYLFWVEQVNNFNITWPGDVIWSPAIAAVTNGAGAIDIFTIQRNDIAAKYGGSFIQALA